ncbi:MAG: hypothetical protein SXA11_15535 [Cyanobacteriota bacterium]|nr:hypothetical protein [Cyanobacteriota bacterium]
MNQEKEDRNKNIIEKINSSELNNIYFNEFAIGVSKHDIFILLSRNGKAEAILNASHITAKSFANSLSEAVREFEAQTNQTILNSDEIEKLMEEDEND